MRPNDPNPSGVFPAPADPPGPTSHRLVWAILPVLVALLLLPLYWGFAGDDTFIHLQYARNLAAGQGFSFNPGEPSYGSTSPLWTVLLAVAGQLTGGDHYLAAKMLGVIFTGLTVFLVVVVARQVMGPGILAILAGLAVAVDPWVLKWGASGMETPLAMALGAGAISLHLRRRLESGIPGSAFLLGVATLVRPEFVALFLLAQADRLLFARRGLGETLFALFLYLVPILPWVIYALGAFGDVIPATIHAKSGHMGRGEVFTRTAKILGATYGPAIVLAAVGGALALRRHGAGATTRAWLAPRTVVWGWVIGLPLAYLVTRSYVASRYLLLVAPFVTVLGFAAVPAISRARATAMGVGLLVALAAASAAIQATVIYPRTRFEHGVDEPLLEVGRWIAANTPRDALVAVHEVGAVGYTCERRVVDTAGLVTRESLPYVIEYRVDDLIRDTRPDYYVSSGDDRTDRQVFEPHGDRMSLVFERQVQRGGSSALFAEPLTVGVYRFDWD